MRWSRKTGNPDESGGGRFFVGSPLWRVLRMTGNKGREGPLKGITKQTRYVRMNKGFLNWT
jgi:hypothetical protein